MNLFSISQLSQFSGIKAHTIRIWEKRYQALKPERSEGNTRYYDNSQLRRLLNIVSLIETGDHKISELGGMTDDQLNQQLVRFRSHIVPEGSEYYVSQLIKAGLSYDEINFLKIYDESVRKQGIKDTYLKVIYPALFRIGMLWASNEFPPAQEHFVSNLITRKLQGAIENLKTESSSSESWLLYLPENEYHEIGLLYANYLVKESGKKSIYLGANVPFESVVKASQDLNLKNILLFLVHHDSPENLQHYIESLSKSVSSKSIYIAANPKILDQLKKPAAVKFITSPEELESVFKVKKLHDV